MTFTLPNPWMLEIEYIKEITTSVCPQDDSENWAEKDKIWSRRENSKIKIKFKNGLDPAESAAHRYRWGSRVPAEISLSTSFFLVTWPRWGLSLRDHKDFHMPCPLPLLYLTSIFHSCVRSVLNPSILRVTLFIKPRLEINLKW